MSKIALKMSYAVISLMDLTHNYVMDEVNQ